MTLHPPSRSEEDFNPDHLRLAFDAMPTAVSWASITDQTILYTNRAFHDLFGYEPSRFKTIAEWVETTYPFAEDRALAWERWGAYFSDPSQTEFNIPPMELRVLCQSGAIKTVLHSGVILPATGRALATFTELTARHARPASSERKAQETEAVYRMLSATSRPEDTDLLNLSPWEALIGERHRQREALRVSEELLDRTGRLAGVGGWDINLLTGVVTWTAETHRLHAVPPGYQPTLEAGIRFYAPEARHTIANVVEQAILTGQGWDVEAPLIRADGQRIWVRVIGSVEVAEGKAIRLTGAFQDITARHDERIALKLANERLLLATASGSIATWDWDIVKHTVFWDERMYAMYGLDPTRGDGSYELWSSNVHPEDIKRVEQDLATAIKTGQPYVSEFRVVWPNGAIHNLRAMGQSILDEEGLPSRMVGVNWDVTEQLRLASEAARALKQELQMKDDFLSHVSHELRSPLASIYSFAGILADGLAGDVTEPQADYLEIILRNSRQLRSMIDDLLQVSQSQTGKLLIALEEASIPEAFTDSLDTLRAAAKLKNVSLISYSEDELPYVTADPTRLRQVLIIILDNAVKFTPVHGFIEVRATRSKATPGFIEVSIADTGTGIQQSSAERIFEHLYQAEDSRREGRKGLGLGLYIARDLVERQGGSIWVESKLGQGSVFRFTIPIFTAPQPTNPWGVERRRNLEFVANEGNKSSSESSGQIASENR